MRNEDISLIEVLRKLRDTESRVLPPSLVWQEVERLILRAAAERDEALYWVDRLETALRQTQSIVDGTCAPASVSKESLLHVPDDVAMRRHLSRAERNEAIARAEAAEARAEKVKATVGVLIDALVAIVDRADNGELGTSKVQDMARIARAALAGKEPADG